MYTFMCSILLFVLLMLFLFHPEALCKVCFGINTVNWINHFRLLMMIIAISLPMMVYNTSVLNSHIWVYWSWIRARFDTTCATSFPFFRSKGIDTTLQQIVHGHYCISSVFQFLHPLRSSRLVSDTANSFIRHQSPHMPPIRDDSTPLQIT